MKRTASNLSIRSLSIAGLCVGLVACDAESEDEFRDDAIDPIEQLDSDDAPEGPHARHHGRFGKHGKRGMHGKHIFRMMDADGDDAVSIEEAQGRVAEMFAEVDADSDGLVTKDELHAFKKSMRDPAKMAERILTKLDANGDGAITSDEAEEHPHFQERFGEADADEDGRVTQEEIEAQVEAHHPHGRRHRGPHGPHGAPEGFEHPEAG